ncbi:carboxylesterase YbfK [bacterium BMS3Abin02]|nr:carboxylesterase YbfK [bacterium BMS3Abin02]GBE21481.1 carboxylesterase YbfK [bacterium BMS3Bbin01]HDL50210.1 alpha/beta hydrolase [Actinomycetota bacterium]
MKLLRSVGLGWLVWRLLGPDTPPRYSGPQRHPLRLPGRTVFVGDREVFVRKTGPDDAPALVLLHGLGLDSMLAWYRLIPLLAERFRIVSIDLYGAGKTDKGRDAFEIADMADQVAGALGALGIGQATVAGYSMGGAVAQELAHRHPHLVERLVLIATLAHHPPAWRWGRTIIGVAGRALERISRVEVSWVWYRYLLRVGAVDPSSERWLWETRMNRDPEMQYRSMFALLRFDSRRWLGRLNVPALVVIPQSDQLVLPAWQREMATLLRDSTVVEVPGARHELPMTHPDQVAEAVGRFAAAQ